MGVPLPPEILSIICELCTTPPGLCGTHDCNKYAISFCCIKKACMALRLVGRDWNAASTPFVFDHIKLRLFPSSVERFTQLCESELAKNVKRLEFHTDLLPVWDKETWLSNVLCTDPDGEERLPESVPMSQLEAYDQTTRQSLSTEELDIGWAAYEKHMLGQQRWHRNTSDLRIMLKDALQRLPNLCRSTVECCPSLYELHRNVLWKFSPGPFLKALAREIIAPPGKWLVWLTSEEPSSIKHVELEDACSLAFVEAIGYRNHSATFKQVKTLTLDLKSQQTFQKLLAASGHADDVNAGDTPRRQKISQACAATTDLTLRIREGAAHAEDDDVQAEDIRQILRAAKGVRTLHLGYGNLDDDEMDLFTRSRHAAPLLSQFALMPILSKRFITYHHLKELFLSAVVPGQALADFLKAHSATLKRLQLQRSISDDWTTVMYTIARHLNLDGMRLYWLIDGYHTYVDGRSWKLKSYNGTVHFNHEQCFYQDAKPRSSFPRRHIRRLDFEKFQEEMRNFFVEKGSLELPPDFYNELHHPQ